jgi:hypothetical protein
MGRPEARPKERKMKDVEFSLAGLSKVLEEYGLRVTAGQERHSPGIMRISGKAKRVYRVSEILLTVALETPEPEAESAATPV